MERLTDDELTDAQRNLAQARASLACEGMFLTAEQEAMFDTFEREHLPHDERIRRIVAYYSSEGRSSGEGRSADAAE